MEPSKTSRPNKVAAHHASPNRKGNFLLRLYIAGATARSREALRRVYQICETELKEGYKLEVIDIYQQPELARKNQIIATPTLIKEFPIPVRRFVGSLGNVTTLFGEPIA
jgi:circadian clock protein KaiB